MRVSTGSGRTKLVAPDNSLEIAKFDLGRLFSEDDMKSFAKKLQRFLTSEDGPTAVEYAVMLALIVIVCLTAIDSIGTNAATTFNNVAGQLGS